MSLARRARFRSDGVAVGAVACRPRSVGADLGFATPSHFAAFRRAYGWSPSALRRVAGGRASGPNRERP